MAGIPETWSPYSMPRNLAPGSCPWYLIDISQWWFSICCVLLWTKALLCFWTLCPTRWLLIHLRKHDGSWEPVGWRAERCQTDSTIQVCLGRLTGWVSSVILLHSKRKLLKHHGQHATETSSATHVSASWATRNGGELWESIKELIPKWFLDQWWVTAQWWSLAFSSILPLILWSAVWVFDPRGHSLVTLSTKLLAANFGGAKLWWNYISPNWNNFCCIYKHVACSYFRSP